MRTGLCTALVLLVMLVPTPGAGAEDAPAAKPEPAPAEQPTPPSGAQSTPPTPSAEKPAAAPEDTPATPAEKPAATADKPADDARESDTREAMCLMIESAARANDLPLEFFARVIWQESRFQADAIGPITRNGQRAQGIAQFMPGTANERGLLDPFNPVQALPKSAEFLSELRNQFGNLGLAAAAYNAGQRRIQDWLAGTGSMPQETRNYVSAITGSSVDDWAAAARNNGKMPERPPAKSCRELMALLKRAPNPFVAGLEQHITLSAAKLWGVQLAAGFSRDKALAMYSRAIKRLSNVIGDQDPSLLSSRLRSRGSATFYQVRIGADSRPEADGLCSRIRKAGGACFVLKNRA